MTNLFRKKSTSFIALSALASAIALSSPAIARDAIGPGDSDSTWVLGTTLGAFNNPFIGEDNDALINPNIRYNGERIFIQEGSVNLHITKSNGFSAGLKFALDGGFLSDEDNYEDNEKLAGLTERDPTILGGIYVNHDSDLGRLSFNTLADVGSEHDGRTAMLKYTFDFRAGNWNINPELGVEWLSGDYVNHYVGVSQSEATSARPQFRADDTTIAFAGVRARYELSEHWDINLKTGLSKLGSEFDDSPLIDDDVIYQASFGINYNF